MTARGWEPDAPKSLADPGEAERRRALAGLPHLVALAPLLQGLRAAHGEVPDPDPLDGGAAARLLLLLETPGPRIRRTGFVSRDNPAETAANLFRFLREAGIARRDTLIWNAVPWVIHAPGALNRAPMRGEIAAGLAELPALIDVLPGLRCAVLAGRVAAGAAPLLSRIRPGLPVLLMPHPSPTYLCTSPTHPARIRAVLGEAAGVLRSADSTEHVNSDPRHCEERRRRSNPEAAAVPSGLLRSARNDGHCGLRESLQDEEVERPAPAGARR